MSKNQPTHVPPLYKAMIPVLILIALLGVNVLLVYQDSSIEGSNQFILMLSAAIAAVIGISEDFKWKDIENGVIKSVSSTTQAIIILLLIGALTGSWLISGIVPAMVYYGLQVLNPTYFLFATCIICALVSIGTGSSWSTVATVGIALLGIGKALGFHEALVAGTIISGAYFGDKISPLSETTNMAAAIAEVPLFDHIKYMLYTTVPSILIALVLYFIIGWNYDSQVNTSHIEEVFLQLQDTFYISPILFVVPLVVIILIIKKVPAIPSILTGVLLGAVFALIFQKDILVELAGGNIDSPLVYYQVIMDALTVDTIITSNHPVLENLLSSSGMSGMMGTVWLIISAMMFGGVMESCNFLKSITLHILKFAKSDSSLVTATVASCISTNVLASDQYLSIIIPGKMYQDAYREKGLAPQNLSRSLEDGGTVTSVLVPWNTCGAYQSSVLGIATLSFAPFCFFNILSPIMSIVYSQFRIKIARI